METNECAKALIYIAFPSSERATRRTRTHLLGQTQIRQTARRRPRRAQSTEVTASRDRLWRVPSFSSSDPPVFDLYDTPLFFAHY